VDSFTATEGPSVGLSTSLFDVVGEPTVSTVNFPLQDVQSKQDWQLKIADDNAATIRNTEGFSELNELLGNHTVQKIAGGMEKVVFRVGNQILRVSTKVPEYGNYVRQLRPTNAGMIGDLYVEVVPEVIMDLSIKEITEFNDLVTSEGMHWDDANIDNLGRTKDGEIVIIDGAVFPRDRFPVLMSPSLNFPYTLQDGDLSIAPDLMVHPLFTGELTPENNVFLETTSGLRNGLNAIKNGIVSDVMSDIRNASSSTLGSIKEYANSTSTDVGVRAAAAAKAVEIIGSEFKGTVETAKGAVADIVSKVSDTNIPEAFATSVAAGGTVV
jgi:hypothetical protein